jgi:ABC-2 type transport system permease protein
MGVQLTLLISLGIFIINILLLYKIMKYNDRHILFEKQIH